LKYVEKCVSKVVEGRRALVGTLVGTLELKSGGCVL
jgi:hypothetical protein